MRLRQYITEMSFTQEDVPRTFRVVLNIDYHDPVKTLKQLGTMKLENITGISDKHDIAFGFLGVARDAMLIMNGQDMLKINKISRIMYDNPHYLFSNNMSGLKRIWMKEGNNTRGLFFNTFEYFFNALVADKVLDKYLHMQYSATYQTLANRADDGKPAPPKINGIKDFIKYYRRLLKAEYDYERTEEYKKRNIMGPDRAITDMYEIMQKTPDSVLEKGVFGMAKIIKQIYGDEGEWVVKDKTLKIPKGSYLYILARKDKAKELNKMKAENPSLYRTYTKINNWDVEAVEKYEKMLLAANTYLKGKYIIKFIDEFQWKKIQGLHLSQK